MIFSSVSPTGVQANLATGDHFMPFQADSFEASFPFLSFLAFCNPARQRHRHAKKLVRTKLAIFLTQREDIAWKFSRSALLLISLISPKQQWDMWHETTRQALHWTKLQSLIATLMRKWSQWNQIMPFLCPFLSKLQASQNIHNKLEIRYVRIDVVAQARRQVAQHVKFTFHEVVDVLLWRLRRMRQCAMQCTEQSRSCKFAHTCADGAAGCATWGARWRAAAAHCRCSGRFHLQSPAVSAPPSSPLGLWCLQEAALAGTCLAIALPAQTRPVMRCQCYMMKE